VGQDVRRLVVAALVLEDLDATVDRASDPKTGDQTSHEREREPAEGGHRSGLDDKFRRRRSEPLALGPLAALALPMVGVDVARTDIMSRVAHRSIKEGRSLGLRDEQEFDR